jgi:tetratricopeptide (TPR) repeat protein
VILREGAGPNSYHVALEVWDEAIAMYPTYAMPYGWKGVVLYKMGNIKEAVSVLEIAARSNVVEAEVYHHLGLCYLALGERDGGGKEKAGGMFKKALQFNAAHAGARTELGKLKQRATAS